MSLSRRAFSSLALSAPFIAALSPTRAIADHHGMREAAPALFDAGLGNYKITALFDGMAPLARGMFSGLPDAEIDAVLAAAGTPGPELPAPVNAYLLVSEDRKILIDAGVGHSGLMGPGFGRLFAGLEAMGLTPADIDTVLVTHLHVDHIGGLMSEEGATFPNAEIVMAEAEAGFWTDAAMQAAAPEAAQGAFQMAQGFMELYGDNVTLVSDGAEVAPGIELVLSPGHTPGHSLLRIDGGDRQMMMIADTIHNATLHTALPDIAFGFDTDSALAAQSRRRLFDMLSADNMLIAGSHVHFPGFGRILRDGEVYSYAAASWG